MAKNSELKGAHFEIFQGFSSNFAKNVRFLYYREANKKRHVPLKVAPMCSKVHGFSHPGLEEKTGNDFYFLFILKIHAARPPRHEVRKRITRNMGYILVFIWLFIYSTV